MFPNKEQYVIPSIGRYRLDKLTPAHIRHAHEPVTEQGLSLATALQAHRILSKCLIDAIREGKVQRNVATLVAAPRRAVTKQTSLPAEQAKVFLQHVVADLSGVRWAVATPTGMRQCEQPWPTREMIDLDRGVITVAWALARVTFEHGCPSDAPCRKALGGNCPSCKTSIPAGMKARQLSGGLWLTRPKSMAGWREVPMPPALTEIVKRYLKDRATLTPTDLVFVRPDRLPRDHSQCFRKWQALLVACKLPDIKLHSARHTAATH